MKFVFIIAEEGFAILSCRKKRQKEFPPMRGSGDSGCVTNLYIFLWKSPITKWMCFRF